MPTPFSSLRDLSDQVLTDIESKTNQDTPTVSVAYNRIISLAVAAMALQNQLHNIDMVKECFPQTASEGFGLAKWADLTGRPRIPGTQAELQAKVTGTTGTTIGTGSTGPRWKSTSGLYYGTTTGSVIAGGEATITIQAETYGEEGTLSVGDEISLTTTIVGIDTKATITAINVSGDDQEDLSSWRAAIIDLAAFPPQIGTAAWFAEKALEVDGITRAYPYCSQTYPGKVEIYAVDDSAVDGTPSASQLEKIEAITDEASQNIMWAYNLLPNGEKRLEAFESPVDEYQVVITDGSPSLSASLKESVETAINNYFLTRNPYINGLFAENKGVIEKVGVVTVAQNAIDAEVGETGRFADIEITKTGEIPVDIYTLGIGTRAKAVISYT